MADPFVAEIRPFPFNFAPKGWARCEGQIMPISQNTALFSLLGTFYGGDGKSTFALPNLQGSAPVANGQGSGLSERVQGEPFGEQNVTLLQSEMPMHIHTFNASGDDARARQPVGQYFGVSQGTAFYNDDQQPITQLNPNFLQVVGQSTPHNNMQPYLTLNFCIALQGVFPPRG